ncbi:MAG: CADD family putative folate metabolism protein [candidate division Zixibacteria bacterium]|nr:CADD family putative folate metabolism protein [candidate division Zixibacteria bacterium]
MGGCAGKPPPRCRDHPGSAELSARLTGLLRLTRNISLHDRGGHVTHSRQVLDQIDALIQRKSILNHPFYVAWEKGELTRKQLATYAKMYYPHVAAFPQYLVATGATAMDATVKAEIDSNLVDELNHPKPHNELWLDFAESLGHNRAAVSTAAPHPAAKNIVDTFNELAQKNTACGLAALYAYESQQPGVAETKTKGLKQNYGIGDQQAHAYFDVHGEIDIMHREGERKALGLLLDNGTDPEEVMHATEQALDAYWALLDGVCEETGVSMVC